MSDKKYLISNNKLNIPCGSHERGVLYIAFGEKYQYEVKRSMRSLRSVSPDLPIAVITDKKWVDNPQPDQFIIRPLDQTFSSKVKHIFDSSPFFRTLYVDTDTFIARDVRPIFGLMNYYDIGVRFYGPMLREDHGLMYHTQCNSGIILFKKNERTEELFSLWKQEYFFALDGHQSIVDKRGLGDQRYLAIAIAKSRARPVHLAEFVHFVLHDPIVTFSPPVVYHGRLRRIEMLDGEISGRWDTSRDWYPRLWLPNLRGLLPRGVRRSDPLLALALISRRIYYTIRRQLKSKI